MDRRYRLERAASLMPVGSVIASADSIHTDADMVQADGAFSTACSTSARRIQARPGCQHLTIHRSSGQLVAFRDSQRDGRITVKRS
jgi:hypothetical protein